MARGRPDLVILDVMMPGEDGLAVCRWLKSETDLPVVMLTAKGEEVDRVIGLEMGADDYVCKPFSPRELLARVRNLLRLTERHRQQGDATGGARRFHFSVGHSTPWSACSKPRTVFRIACRAASTSCCMRW